MNLLNFISSASAAADPTQTGGILGLLTMILPLGLMVLVFWFLIIRPEKKRTKEMQNMLDSLQVADEVITNGGIIGRVLSVQKDTVLIETGSDRTKIRVVMSAIAKNNTEHENAAPAVEGKKTKGNKTEIK